jgi:ATP-dependent Zn protease
MVAHIMFFDQLDYIAKARGSADNHVLNEILTETDGSFEQGQGWVRARVMQD